MNYAHSKLMAAILFKKISYMMNVQSVLYVTCKIEKFVKVEKKIPYVRLKNFLFLFLMILSDKRIIYFMLHSQKQILHFNLLCIGIAVTTIAPFLIALI